MSTTDYRSILIAIGAAAGATLAIHLWKRHTAAETTLPPSPKSYPLIGNLLSMPTGNLHIGFIELGKELNTDMFSLSVLGTVIIGLNSVEDATNLLEKRSNIYSDRVLSSMLTDPSLVDLGRLTSLLPYNDRWRKNRRLMHPWLNQNAVKAFKDSQEKETRSLLFRLAQSAHKLEFSEELFAEFSLALGKTLARSIYGYRLERTDDPFLSEMHKILDRIIEAGMPTNFLVNLFPSLRHAPDWLPGTGWKKNVIKDSYDWTKSRITMGDDDASKSIVASMINHSSHLGLSVDETDDYVSHIAFTLYAGGVDTSANVFLVVALAMILNPEVQTKAQKEIDEVIGRD